MSVDQLPLFDSDRYKAEPVLVQRLVSIKEYREYLQSPHWQAFRQWTLEARGHRCERCHRKDGLNVHHLTYERRGHERLDDVVVLCLGCHRREHAIAAGRRRDERWRLGGERKAA